MARKPKNSIEVNLRARLDPSSGSIIFTPNDRKLRGLPFLLKLNSSNPSYNSIYKLLEKEGIADLSGSIPTRSSIDTLDTLLAADLDPRFGLSVGLTPEGPLEWRLGSDADSKLPLAPHTFTYGAYGSGLTVMERSIATHALANGGVELWAIDTKGSDPYPRKLRDLDRRATTLAEAAELLSKADSEIKRRRSLLEKTGVTGISQTMMTSIFLHVHELAQLTLHSSDDSTEEADLKVRAADSLLSILRHGRGAGVFAFLFSSRIDAWEKLSGEAKSLIGRRVALGRMNSSCYASLWGAVPRFGAAMFEVPGRGIEMANNEQTIFQMHYGDMKNLDRLLEERWEEPPTEVWLPSL